MNKKNSTTTSQNSARSKTSLASTGTRNQPKQNPGRTTPAPRFNPVQGVPPGLEALHAASGVGVRQELDKLEMILPVEYNNRYSVFNAQGQRIYFAAENTGTFEKIFWKEKREFRVVVFDGTGREIMYIEKERGSPLGGTMSASTVTVTMAQTKIVLGKLVQEMTCCTPEYHIQNPQGKITARIEGDSQFGNAMFTVTDPNTSKVIASIQRKFKVVNVFVDSKEAFGVLFKAPIDVRLKAVLLATVILIDFNFFEK